MFEQGKARGRWLLVAAWAAVIFALSSIPGMRIPTISVKNFDKVEHFGVYAILGLLAGRAVQRTLRPRGERESGGDRKSASAGNGSGYRVVLAAAALTTLYGVTDEIHQRWVPGRDSDVHDVMADALGGCVGAAVSLIF